MPFRPFNALSSQGQPGGSSILDRIQQALSETLDSLKGAITNEGLITQAIPTGADVKVYHRLGRPPTTVEIVNRNANANVWESATPNTQREIYVLLQSSANVTVTVRIS